MRSYNRTQELMEANRDKLVKIAALLLEKEVLSSDEINAIIDGKKKPERPAAAAPSVQVEAGAAPAAPPDEGPGEG